MNKEYAILDVGCGNKKRAGAIGIDFNSRTQADVIHDLNSFPYPFEDSYFNEIYIDNCLEHLDDVMKVMEEIYRICKPGGSVKVIVPYFRSLWAFTDPTHKHFFGVNSFTYFDPDHMIFKRYAYTKVTFKTERIVFNETLSDGWIKRMFVFVANRYPFRYENYLSHLYPLDDITFYLRKI
ncbi:class I SAM-dependent methyltransferase [Leptospira adleri]|uniref:SAM-dependent methyltransferase n=1 Tax=Leptospira adleri TaxID=2023186 RepID=A0ABX4NYA2_9LEPT|nr:methyltransferase domain-containing protein [Leptospira adleri]PJZ61808.1 SAM-dependent methyltransferase [Leptospira adleri]